MWPWESTQSWNDLMKTSSPAQHQTWSWYELAEVPSLKTNASPSSYMAVHPDMEHCQTSQLHDDLFQTENFLRLEFRNSVPELLYLQFFKTFFCLWFWICFFPKQLFVFGIIIKKDKLREKPLGHSMLTLWPNLLMLIYHEVIFHHVLNTIFITLLLKDWGILPNPSLFHYPADGRTGTETADGLQTDVQTWSFGTVDAISIKKTLLEVAYEFWSPKWSALHIPAVDQL